jgi:type I restriction enzyme, S subunit
MTTPLKYKWPSVPLADVAEFRNGVNYSKVNFGKGVKVIGVSDFQDNVKASFGDLEEINPAGVVRKEHYLKDGDILFVRSNGNRDLIGRNMFVENPPEEVTHSAFSIRLRFVCRDCLPRFYAYVLRSPLFRQSLSLHGGGTNISNLNQDILGRLQVPLPPRPVQHQIASILSAYDDLIENNARRIKILEEMAQMVYREWFVNFHFPGYEKLQLAKRGEGGQIPMGWRVGLLGELVSLRSGFAFKSTTFDSEGLFGLVTIRNVHDGAFSPECQSQIADLPPNLPKYCVLEAGDIVMSLTGNIGRVCFVFGSNLLLNQRVAKVISSRPGDLPFVYFLLRQTETQKRFEQISTGVAQQNLSPVKAMEERVVVPPKELRERFGEIVQPMTAEIVNLFTCGTILRQTRDLLLPKLVSGEINLENVEANALSQIP